MALSSRICRNILENVKRTSNTACMSTKVSDKADKTPELKNNELILQEFTSRNPRNLEFMHVAYKPSGYKLDKPGREFWNKLVVKPSHHFVTAEIIHSSGVVVVSVSSAEWGIKKQLYRYTDSCAHKAVGTVLAARALECGITNVYCNIPTEEGQKLDFLLKAAQAGGLSLEEQPRYLKPDIFKKIQQTPPWDDLKLV